MVWIFSFSKKQLPSNPARLLKFRLDWWLVNVIMINYFLSNSVTTLDWLPKTWELGLIRPACVSAERYIVDSESDWLNFLELFLEI